MKENPIIQNAVEAGFDFNSAFNGIPLKKYTSESLDGRHANHPYYNSQINDFLIDVWLPANPNYTNLMAKEKLVDLVQQLRVQIESSTDRINKMTFILQ